MAHFWSPEYLNPVLDDITEFEECNGFKGFSINTRTKQIINTRTRRVNCSKSQFNGLPNLTLENGDYFVNVPKHRIAGITHNAQILYSEIEKMHHSNTLIHRKSI